MNSGHDLRLDWCSYEAAKYACEHWHYSKSIPPRGQHVQVGIWEGGGFVGVVLYGRGASPKLVAPYGVSPTEGCELVRVAMRSHAAPVSRCVAVSLRFLRRLCPGIRVVVSFADPQEGHHGGIHQAGGWTYLGTTSADHKYRDRLGRVWHSRQVSKTGEIVEFGKRRVTRRHDECERIATPGKHRYAMPLDKAMRRQLASMSKPYPKRVRSDTSDTLPVQGRKGGATPTRTLQK